MRFTTAGWLLAVLASIALLSLGGVDAVVWDPTKNRYCGVAPHPAELAPLPKLPAGARFVRSYNFFRHGARTPTGDDTCFLGDTTVWNDCSNNMRMEPDLLRRRAAAAAPYDFPVRPNDQGQAIPGTCTLGCLLDRGLLQAYAQGRRLGAALDRYFSAQGAELTLADMDARSTDYHRTRATTLGLLTGVVDVAVRNATADALPAVRFRDFNGDYMAMSDKICKSAPYIKEAYADPAWVAYEEETFATMRPAIDAITGVTHTDVKRFFDCIKARLCSGKDLPAAYTPALDAQLSVYMDRYWSQVFYFDHTRASRLFSGGVLLALYGDLLAVREAGPAAAPRALFRGGHDFGPMMNLVSALDIGGAGRSLWPPYVSMLNLDVYTAAGGALMVRAVHEGEAQPIGICSSTGAGAAGCSLDALIAALEPLLPTTAECPHLVPEPVFLKQYRAASHSGGVSAAAAAKVDGFVQRAHALNVMRLDGAKPLPTQRSHAETWASAHDDL